MVIFVQWSWPWIFLIRVISSCFRGQQIVARDIWQINFLQSKYWE
uniref:Uncharacterized protein n=1 Tax=Anguilla anguilla TaxID=7936 RepID=A0A0E9SJ51_ANGAN